MRRSIAAGAIVAAIVAAVWAWRRAPTFALDAARGAVRTHLGAEIAANEIAVGATSVRMTGVRLLRDGAAAVEIDELSVAPSLRDLLVGRKRFKSIRARGVRLDPAAFADGPSAEARDVPEPGSSSEKSENEVLAALRRLERASDLLARGGTVEIDGVRLSAPGDGPPVTVEHARLERVSSGLRTEGRVTGGGGSATWDVDVDPEALHATGDLRIEGLPLAAIASLAPRMPFDDARDARIEGVVTIGERAPGEPPHVLGRLAIRDLWLASERLAERPIGPIDLELWGDADWDLGRQRFDVRDGGLRWNGVEVLVRGALAPSLEHYLVDLEVTLPEIRCDRALGAMPDAVLGELDGFAWDGSVSGRGRFLVDAENLDATEFDVRLDNRCEFVSIPAVADLTRFEGPFDHVAPAPDDGFVLFRTGPGTDAWTPLDRVSPFLLHAVLAHEDAGFFDHAGFAQYAIEDALEKNLERRRFAFGASTISMQLARNLFLTRDKTLARKVREVLLTWWIEDRWTKRQILELYLNVIEYGPELYGVRAAALHHFDCEPADLTLAQSAYLATILPAPVRFHGRNFAAGTLTAYTREQMEFLVRHMAKRGRIGEDVRDMALVEIESFGFERRDARWSPGMTAELPLEPAEPAAWLLQDQARDDAVEPEGDRTTPWNTEDVATGGR
jgi:hypothetical protein